MLGNLYSSGALAYDKRSRSDRNDDWMIGCFEACLHASGTRLGQIPPTRRDVATLPRDRGAHIFGRSPRHDAIRQLLLTRRDFVTLPRHRRALMFGKSPRHGAILQLFLGKLYSSETPPYDAHRAFCTPQKSTATNSVTKRRRPFPGRVYPCELFGMSGGSAGHAKRLEFHHFDYQRLLGTLMLAKS